MTDKFEQQKKEWYEENAPYGRALGYPDCCIKEFCDQPPALLKELKRPSQDDYLRYKAGCINGEFTGFIPCCFHAKQIIDKKISLHSLIKNRDKAFPDFPNI